MLKPLSTHQKVIPLVDLKAQYREIEDQVQAAINTVLREASFIQGPHVRTFEQEFASYLGVNHCLGVASGTDALVIALKALGIGPGDEVITVANSFVATAEAIVLCGARPVFVDCRADDFLMDTTLLEAARTDKTKAVIAVHLYGQPCDLQSVVAFVREHNLALVEDCAQAHGAKYQGQSVGSFGDLSCFSFFPGKNLGAYGDGGAIVSMDSQLIENARRIANHGGLRKYEHEVLGTNSRLDGLQAAVLSVKLKHLPGWTEQRRAVAQLYNQHLPSGVQSVLQHEQRESVYHLYVISCQQRDQLIQGLKQRGVNAGIHYPCAIPLLKAFEYLQCSPSDFPVSYTWQRQVLSLPIHGSLSIADAQFVLDALKDTLEGMQ